MAAGRKSTMPRPQRSSAAAPKAKSAAASTVPREEALQRLQEAYTVLRQTKQGNGMLSQAEQGLKLFEAQASTAAEYDKTAAEKYKDKKTPLSAEELKEFAQLQNDIELYKAKLRSEFGYSNKDIKADPDLKDMETRLAAFQKRS